MYDALTPEELAQLLSLLDRAYGALMAVAPGDPPLGR
jgi:hypothetical protein